MRKKLKRGERENDNRERAQQMFLKEKRIAEHHHIPRHKTRQKSLGCLLVAS